MFYKAKVKKGAFSKPYTISKRENISTKMMNAYFSEALFSPLVIRNRFLLSISLNNYSLSPNKIMLSHRKRGKKIEKILRGKSRVFIKLGPKLSVCII